MSGRAVAVVVGGPSTEAEVSRTGGRAVAEALARAGYRATLLELDATLPVALSRERFDAVFPVTHGQVGEDGSLQGLLEVLDLPYVGSGVLASALAASKPHAKVAFRSVGLPLAASEVVGVGERLEVRVPELRRTLGPAFVAKPASGGSAIGVELVGAAASDADAIRAVERVLALEPHVLVEAFVSGQEATCGVLERDGRPEALPPTLIRPLGEYYDFESKYRAGGSEHVCPAPFSDAIVRGIQEAAVAAHRVLGCRDLSRTDFLVDEAQGTFVLLETNTLPGMTPTSLFPEAAARAGIPFERLCDELVRAALARPRRPAPAARAMP